MAAAVAGGVNRVQLREKDLAGRALFALARAIDNRIAACNETPQRIVNRRIDVARAAAWDGVHLGFDAPTVADARALLPAGAIVGVSHHAADDLAACAPAERPDYAQLAPLWPPNSKPARGEPLGLDALAQATRAGIPIIAQGGIDAERAAACIAAGAIGVAVTGAIMKASSPEHAAATLRRAIDAAAAAR